MKNHIAALIAIIMAGVVSLSGSVVSTVSSGSADPPAREQESAWQEDFGLAERTLVASGRNQYFILEPGYQIVLEGAKERLVITVLDETVSVDGITTSVVEEKEWKNGKLTEVSRNFFAICKDTLDVFYFGEDVNVYRNGKVSSHEGTWRAGKGDAKPGLMMPGAPRVGMKYYQEIAPDLAMDRAEVISLDETLKTPAGTLNRCLKTREGTALHPMEREFKIYAPGIGLSQDADLLLTKHEFLKK